MLQETEAWFAEHDGLSGWIVVDVVDGKPVGYLWDSVELVAGEWDNTGQTQFHPFPSADSEPWDGSGLELFTDQGKATAEAARLNAQGVAERESIGLLGTAAVAFFSRLDDEEL